jgi:aspartyl-tRNA(Asn)/glutamyl-tRNA(Gln) amidotransferase subunit A
LTVLTLSMRFGTSRDGLPIGVQIVSSWLAESSVVDVALSLENLSRVRDLRPNL